MAIEDGAPKAPADEQDTAVEHPLDAQAQRAVKTLRKLAEELGVLHRVVETAARGVASGKLVWDHRLAQEFDTEVRIGVRGALSALDKMR